MRFHQCHALDVILGQAFLFGESLEEVAPPEGLLCRLALGNVDGKVVRQRGWIDLIPDQRKVEQGSGDELVLDHSTLAEVQAARTHPGDGFRALHGNFLVALLVVVTEFVLVSGNGVLGSEQDVLPDVCGGVFQIDHDGRRSGIQQFHRQLSIVGRAGHLIALIGAPVGHLDAPVGGGRF